MAIASAGLSAQEPQRDAAVAPANQLDLSEEELTDIVLGLGANSFQQREKSTAALLQLGPECLPMLRRYASVGDTEIQQRVATIIQRLQAEDFESRASEFIQTGRQGLMPGWRYAEPKLGNSRVAREAYISICRKYADFVEVLEKSKEARNEALVNLTNEIGNSKQSTTYTPNQEDFLAVLLLASDAEVQRIERADAEIVSFLMRVEAQSPLNDAQLGGPIREMLTSWFPMVHPRRRASALVCGIVLDLSECLALVEELLQMPQVPVDSAEVTFQALSRFGTPEQALWAKPHLDDTRTPQVLRFAVSPTGEQLSITIADYAMAAIAIANDVELRDIGFPAGQSHPLRGFVEESVGFPRGEKGARQRARVRDEVDQLLKKTESAANRDLPAVEDNDEPKTPSQ